MTAAAGRREAHKLGTRQALQEAAARLFAERGYSETTVRDIAEAAGVTQRTFFRYFTGKEDLILDEALDWLPVLQESIRERPAGEDPVTAVRRAVLALVSARAKEPGLAPLWMFSDAPPGMRLGRSVRGALARVEAGLAEVIRERLEQSGQPYPVETAYLADVLGRVAFAAIRSALQQRAKLRREGRKGVSLASLINEAFSTLQLPLPPRQAMRPPQDPD